MRERKRNRKLDFDYSQDGYYFVTIVTKNRINYFGEIVDNSIILNRFGEIVKKQWLWLHIQYKYLNIDEFVIMPNHFHGIINISRSVGPGRADQVRGRSRPART